MHFKNSLQRINFILFCTIILAACKKSDIDLKTIQQNRYSLSATELNYVVNSGFINWNSAVLPNNWQANFDNNDFSGLSNLKPGIELKRNADGRHYFFQTVKLENNQFYKASLFWQYDIKDFNKGGLYIMDSAMQNVLGKIEKADQAGQDTLTIIFNSKQHTTINIVLGFLDGLNASVQFKQVTLAPYTFNPKISSSILSAYLTQQLNLSFDQLNFDSSIQRISDYVNEVLLCQYYGGNCTDQTNWLLNNLDNKQNYTFFIKNLHELSTIGDSYCQRSSLTLNEILSNEFNIPAHQVHMIIDNIGRHQFMEYWNPYLEKWVVIDPYFSGTYIKNGTFLSADQIEVEDIPVHLKKFGSHFFPSTVNELLQLWQNLDELNIKTTYSKTYPFGG